MNAVQTPDKLTDTFSLWHNVEKPVFQDKLLVGEVSGINMYTIDGFGEFIPLSEAQIDLLKLKGTRAMMISPLSQKLGPFYRFFETHGTERLNGLDESYFRDLNASERAEAWNFLIKRGLSEETVKGLYLLDRDRAIAVMAEFLASPMQVSPYPAEQEELERARLSIINYLNSVDPSERYIAAMCDFARSKFESVRALFAQSLPINQITPGAVEALKGMIFTETETISLSSAITKLMAIYGLDFDRHDPLYKSIYMSLRSAEHKEKISTIRRLEAIRQPDYL